MVGGEPVHWYALAFGIGTWLLGLSFLAGAAATKIRYLEKFHDERTVVITRIWQALTTISTQLAALMASCPRCEDQPKPPVPGDHDS